MIFIYSLAFTLAFIFAGKSVLASSNELDSYTNYCCGYGSISGKQDVQCSLGGCDTGTPLDFWYPVDDCSDCQSSFRNSTTSIKTHCSFCGDNGSQCDDQISNTGCNKNGAKALYSFQIASNPTAPAQAPFLGLDAQNFCCWFSDNNGQSYTVGNSVGGCPHSASHTLQFMPLLAFKEHRFAFDCPARPNCEADCHGHGLCAVSQCVCELDYYGASCAFQCDADTCIKGRCVSPPDALESAYWNAADMFDEEDEWADDDPSVTSTPACECFANARGPNCAQCTGEWGGPNCTTTCLDGPCDGEHMTGECDDKGMCVCKGNWEGRDCDDCPDGFVGDDCGCSNKLCGAPLRGHCSRNGTCTCRHAWLGDHCDQCDCSDHGECSETGTCECPDNFDGKHCEKCAKYYYNYNSSCSDRCIDHTDIDALRSLDDDDDLWMSLNTTCKHNGTCSDVGVCQCPPNARGDNCEECDLSYYGAACEVYCDSTDTCLDLGTCNVTTGLCDCEKEGFTGNCTVCAEHYYPEGECTKQCNPHIECHGHGHCNATGDCECFNYTLFVEGTCAVKLWLIIAPCVLLVALFLCFYAGVVYYKRNQYDEWSEPLLY